MGWRGAIEAIACLRHRFIRCERGVLHIYILNLEPMGGARAPRAPPLATPLGSVDEWSLFDVRLVECEGVNEQRVIRVGRWRCEGGRVVWKVWCG